jgi:hypothetical protein
MNIKDVLGWTWKLAWENRHGKRKHGTYQRNPDTGHRTLRISSTNLQQQTSPIFTHRHTSHTHSPHTGPPEINHKIAWKIHRSAEPEEAPSKTTPKPNTRTYDLPSQRSKDPARNSAEFTCFRFPCRFSHASFQVQPKKSFIFITL